MLTGIEGFSLVALGSVCILSAVACQMVVPETLGRRLPDSIKELDEEAAVGNTSDAAHTGGGKGQIISSNEVEDYNEMEERGSTFTIE